MPHGNGCWTWNDGAKFLGQMKEGKRHGFGILFYARDKNEEKQTPSIEYQGNWYRRDILFCVLCFVLTKKTRSDDLLNGKAKRYARNGVLRYEGCDFI
jgi:hypothetical protein